MQYDPRGADFDRAPDAARYRQTTVLMLLGISRSTLWRRIRSGQFPAGNQDAGVLTWTAGQIRAHRQQPARPPASG